MDGRNDVAWTMVELGAMVWLAYDGPAPGKKWDNGGIVVEGLNVMVGSSCVVMGCVVLVDVTF